MSSDFKLKNWFFDKKAVMDRIPDAKRNALSKIGAFLRTRMKSVTGKKSKTSAKPGEPPMRHLGQLHDLIYFAYEPVSGNVDTGPVPFGTNAAGLLEHGGDAKIKHANGKIIIAHYMGNPFAAPSLDAEIAAGTIPEAFSGMVRS